MEKLRTSKRRGRQTCGALPTGHTAEASAPPPWQKKHKTYDTLPHRRLLRTRIPYSKASLAPPQDTHRFSCQQQTRPESRSRWRTTLHPVTYEPSSARRHAPTWKWALGEYALSLATRFESAREERSEKMGRTFEALGDEGRAFFGGEDVGRGGHLGFG